MEWGEVLVSAFEQETSGKAVPSLASVADLHTGRRGWQSGAPPSHQKTPGKRPESVLT